MRTRQCLGFTLMELLIVIAIIGVLAAILLPSLAKSRETTRRASCAASLSQIGMALHMYADEHDRQFPWSGGGNNADALLYFFPRYGLSEYDFVCPSDSNNGLREYSRIEPAPRLETDLKFAYSLRASYEYFGAYTRQPITLPGLSAVGFPKIPLMWDKGSADRGFSNHVPGGSNVLWMDGSVSFETMSRFASANLPLVPEGIDYLTPAPVPIEITSAQIEDQKRREEQNRARQVRQRKRAGTQVSTGNKSP